MQHRGFSIKKRSAANRSNQGALEHSTPTQISYFNVKFNQEMASRKDFDAMFSSVEMSKVDAILTSKYYFLPQRTYHYYLPYFHLKSSTIYIRLIPSPFFSDRLFPFGSWAVALKNPRQDELLSSLSSFDRFHRTTITELNREQHDRLLTARHYNISRRMIRVEVRSDGGLNMGNALYMFDSFGIDKCDIRLFNKKSNRVMKDFYGSPNLSDFFINFKSFEDAMSAYKLMDGTYFNGNRVNLTLYDI